MPKAVSKAPHARGQAVVAGAGGEVLAVELREQVELERLRVPGGARRRAQVRNRVLRVGDVRAGVAGGQEVVVPDLAAGVGHVRGEDDEGGEVAVFGAEAVAHPGAEARAGDGERAGVQARASPGSGWAWSPYIERTRQRGRRRARRCAGKSSLISVPDSPARAELPLRG